MATNYTVREKSFDDSIEQADTCSNVRLVRSGMEFFELLENLVDQAKGIIHLQTYIFAEDETGMRIARALMSAARRGVNVFVIADGYASQGLSEKFLTNLKRAGVYFRYFDPVLKSKYFYFGRRLHHKVVTIDGQSALVGGINVSNHYNDTFENVAWLDWALYIEGNAVLELEEICAKRSKFAEAHLTPASLLPMLQGSCPVKVNINDWVRGKKEITRSYLRMLGRAQSHVTIMSSYFLPGKLFRKQLRDAAARGVNVRIIAAGMSDVGLSKYAERHMYRWMLRNNIEIYEYQPRILHAKIATCDSSWLTVGSYNVNNISAYASIELNVEIENQEFVRNTDQRLEQILKRDCKAITYNDVNKESLIARFLQRSAYDIFRLLLFLFTFYFKEHK